METKTKIYIGTGIVVLGVASYFIFKPKGKKNGFGGDVGTNDFEVGTSVASLPFNAKQKAENLHELMRGFWKDETGILTELTGVTAKQFGLVSKAFGARKYNTTTGNTKAVIGFDLPKLSLRIWLLNELSKENYKLLKGKFLPFL